MVRPSDGAGEDGRSWMELNLAPGQSALEHLLVRNLSAETVTFRLSAADGYFTDTGRFNMLTAGEDSTGAGTWIDLQDDVEVPSGADVIVPFTISVPDNAEPGDHPAGVAASIRSGEDAEVGIESRVGFRVMTRVTGELTPLLATSVSAHYTGSLNPFEPGTTHLVYEVRNTGNTRLAVTPTASLAGPFGLFAKEIALDPIAEIAPGETRVLRHDAAGVWPTGVLTVGTHADATAVIDATAAPAATATTSVAAVPWPQAGVVAAMLLLIVAAGSARRRRSRRVADMIDRARSEGRAEAIATRAALALAPVLLASSIIFAPVAAPLAAAAASGEPDDRNIVVTVDVTPVPSPATSAPPHPDQEQLAATGRAVPVTLVTASVALLGLGLWQVSQARRGRRAHSRVER
ncbi:COG1470 family protein [Microbacterium radiodurans]|uniref:DUF916 domain-containing protein n=1 Tax=Microbacterium radiodurans TaxID=661398 RepID=A0A5J5IQN4_9MICO|nr:hypothetical protein [Microbacterium radiodurans]KAA9083758.1 hypothetical protein F6B42_14505 [Microbacterium radiodurans]